jgi:hypothetical protein
MRRTERLSWSRSSASAVPIPIVRPTLAAVKTIVRASVSQKIGSCRTELKLSKPMYTPFCAMSSSSP